MSSAVEYSELERAILVPQNCSSNERCRRSYCAFVASMKFATSVLAAEAAVIVLELVVLSRANGRRRWAAVAVVEVTRVGENDATVEALGNVNVRSA